MDPWVHTFTFPGRITKWDMGHEVERGDGWALIGGRVKGSQITVVGRIQAKTAPTSILHVWVKATHIVP
jgi:hypothetical protein